MAGLAGFEPAHDGIKTRCLTAWRQPSVIGCNPSVYAGSHLSTGAKFNVFTIQLSTPFSNFF